jgi:hypothetical protein
MTPEDRRHARGRTPSTSWLTVLVVLAVVETVSVFVTRARAPQQEEWRQAAELVRAEWQPGDAVAVAPLWAEPLVREAMGAGLNLAVAARPDRTGYSRLWHFSIRGHRSSEAPSGAPELERRFGAVLVSRFPLPSPSRVTYDFVSHVEQARVTLLDGVSERECRWSRGTRATGGGLGQGPITPGDRAICDPARSWLWVGETVVEDLAMRPRRCVWQNPAGRDPVRTSFPAVTLTSHIRVWSGLWWEHERWRNGGPVRIAVRVDGRELAHSVHLDGEGWEALDVNIPAELVGHSATVEFDVTSNAPHQRSFCWAAEALEDAPS